MNYGDETSTAPIGGLGGLLTWPVWSRRVVPSDTASGWWLVMLIVVLVLLIVDLTL